MRYGELDDATLDEVLQRAGNLPGLVALVLVGSAARGELLPHSDIDVMAVIADDAGWAAPVRDGGRDVFFNAEGRQVELSYTTPSRLERRMREEAAEGRRARMDWAEDGVVLEGRGTALDVLQATALALLADGPRPLTPDERSWEVFDAWNSLKDAVDSETDETLTALLGMRGFEQLLRLFLRLSQTWEPRPRMLLSAINDATPSFAQLARGYLEAPDAGGRISSLQRMASWLEREFDITFAAPYRSRPPER